VTKFHLIAIDTSKPVFVPHGVYDLGRCTLALAHGARLIAPRYVRPFVKRGKNDRIGPTVPRQIPGRSACTSRRVLAIWIAAGVLLSAGPVRSADVPTLLVLPLELVDTSGEPGSGLRDHAERLAALTGYLSQQLAEHEVYAVVDATPIAAEIGRVRAVQAIDRCNGCERDLARLAHADRVLIGEIDKVSTLIGSLRLDIVDVATGHSVFSRDLSFRGDTDDAWQHAARFFVRDLQETSTEQR
jgi:hypothetical protein